MSKRLVCPECEGGLQPILEYVSGSYSEHRNWEGTECVDCFQEWNTEGDPRD